VTIAHEDLYLVVSTPPKPRVMRFCSLRCGSVARGSQARIEQANLHLSQLILLGEGEGNTAKSCNALKGGAIRAFTRTGMITNRQNERPFIY